MNRAVTAKHRLVLKLMACALCACAGSAFAVAFRFADQGDALSLDPHSGDAATNDQDFTLRRRLQRLEMIDGGVCTPYGSCVHAVLRCRSGGAQVSNWSRFPSAPS